MLIRTLLIAGVGLMTVAACDTNDGPAEEMGEQIDNTIDETADSAEELGEDMDNAVEEAEDEIENPGQ